MQLTIIPNALDHKGWEHIQTDDVLAALTARFDKFPPTARLYHESVALANDVTPGSEEDVQALRAMPGPFFVVVYPADPLTAAYIVFAALVVVAITARPRIPVVSQRTQNTGSSNNALSERTNRPRLGGRIPDIYGTVLSVPDMAALPYTVFENHIEVDYAFLCIGRGSYDFPSVDGAPRIRDGQTLVSKIDGATVEIYAPFTSPNAADTPQLRIGDPITVPVVSAARSKAVNGQVLVAPNDAGDARIVGEGDIRFGPTNHIEASVASLLDFTTVFAATDPLTLTAPAFEFPALSDGVGIDSVTWNYSSGVHGGTVSFHDAGTITIVGATAVTLGSAFISHAFTLTVPPLTKDAITVNLSGHYAFVSFAYDSGTDTVTITLDSPNLSHPDWDLITGMTGAFVSTTSGVAMIQGGTAYLSDEYVVDTVAAHIITLVNPYAVTDYWNWIIAPTAYVSPTLEAVGASTTNWVGPFVLDTTTMNQVISNYVAAQGAWKDNGTTQTAFNIVVQLGVTPCDAAGTATGAESFYNVTVNGSASVKSQRAATIRANIGFTGRVFVRSRRLTNKDTTFVGSIADEIKWRDVYAVSPVSSADFGNVTTVYAVTQATQGALAVSERQLNMLVTRKLPARIGTTNTFTATLTATRNAADIICAICLDPLLGRRTIAELDVTNIYDTVAAVQAYFNVTATGEFCYTFDNDNISFEEMLDTISNAIFCNAYRQGSVIRLFFEKLQPNSTLLFNHRNKLPGTETRSFTFGQENDGVELEYVSPVDDAVVTFYVPEDRSALRAKKIEALGVRSVEQAYLHAYRAFNRMRYQVLATEFEATEEAAVLVLNERILVEDNTRADVQDGYVTDVDALVLYLSQPVTLLVGETYTIFLQHPDATVQGIAITAGPSPYSVTLGAAPTIAVQFGEVDIPTRYVIAKASDPATRRAFLVAAKDNASNFTSKLTAINYDARYYTNDTHYV